MIDLLENSMRISLEKWLWSKAHRIAKNLKEGKSMQFLFLELAYYSLALMNPKWNGKSY